MPVPAGTRMNWTDTSDKKLLLLILQQFPSHSANFDDVAVSMAANTTAEACRKRLIKIKKEVAASTGSTTATASTPSKRSSSTKQANTTSASKRKAKTSAMTDGSDPAGEDDDDEESPLKKTKYQPIKEEYKIDYDYESDLL